MSEQMGRIGRAIAVCCCLGALACGESSGSRTEGGGVSSGGEPTQGVSEEQAQAFEANYERELVRPENLFEREDPTPIVVPWTRVLTPEQSEQIVEVEPDRVVFEAGADLPELEPMQILSSYDEDNYFLRRVVSVSEQQGQRVVRTVDARLDEVIVKGSFSLAELPTGPTPPSMSMRQQPLGGAVAEYGSFDLDFDQRSFTVEPRIPFGGDAGYAFKPSLQARLLGDIQTDFGFEADIAFSGNARMCDQLTAAAEDETRRESIFSLPQTWPAEQRQLAWAIRWAGNTRDDRGVDDMGLECNVLWAFDCQFTGRIPMRDTYAEAVEGFQAYVEERGLGDEFVFSEGGVRKAGVGNNRAEILARYRRLRDELPPDPREDMGQLLAALEATQPSDDLQWIGMAPIVARQHCAGRAEGVKVHAVTSADVESKFAFKLEQSPQTTDLDGMTEGRWRRDTFANSNKYFYELIPKWKGPVSWFWVGWFPIVFNPEFILEAYFQFPTITADVTLETGSYTHNVRVGFDADYTNGRREFDPIFEIEQTDDSDWRAVNGMESSVNVDMAAGIQPDFIGRFYGVAGLGLSTPVYGRAHGEVRSYVRGGEGIVEGRSRICLGADAGVRVDLLGRLDYPFEVLQRAAQTRATHTVFDTCTTQNETLAGFCQEYSVGMTLTSDASGAFFDDAVVSTESAECPTEKLEIRIEWREETDVDLYIQEPGGDVLSYQSDGYSDGGGLLHNDGSCRPKFSGTCRAERMPFHEYATWGEATGIAPRGEFRVWAINESGDAAANVDLKITHTREDGSSEDLVERTLSLSAEENDRSQDVTFSIAD